MVYIFFLINVIYDYFIHLLLIKQVFRSDQISRSVVSDSLQPRESQHAGPPCPSPTPGVLWDSRPLSQWCHPAISSSVVPFSSCPPIPPSIRVFSNESTLCMRWPKYWSFSFSIIPSKEIPGLISFRIDWLDLLAVQGTLKSLLQHHSSKTLKQVLERYNDLSKAMNIPMRQREWIMWFLRHTGFPSDSDSKESAYNVADLGSIPG